MSEHEKRLRATLWRLRDVVPKLGETAIQALDALMAEQRASGLDGAIEVFSKRQAEVERQRLASKVRSNAELADMKAEIARCSWANHTLRAVRGHRKKGKEKAG